jgi:hypothetical protein
VIKTLLWRLFLGGFDSEIFSNKEFKEFVFIQLDEFDIYYRKLRLQIEKENLRALKKSKLSSKDKKSILLNLIFKTIRINDCRSTVMSTLFRAITFHNINNKVDSEFYMSPPFHKSEGPLSFFL